MRNSALALLVPALLTCFALSDAQVEAASPSPDPTHPYVTQLEGAHVATASLGSVQPLEAPLRPLAVGGGGGPQREIFGFALAGTMADATVGYPSWNFSLLSTVAFFGLHIQDNGTIAADSGRTVWNSSQLTGLLSTAHSSGTKVVLTVIMQDFAARTPHMCAALAHSSTTVAAVVAEVKAKGVDGVNLDYEGLNGSCGTTDGWRARHLFISFTASLRAALPAGSYLSVDTYASSASDTAGFFDVQNLNKSVDSFFVMAYDLEYSNARAAYGLLLQRHLNGEPVPAESAGVQGDPRRAVLRAQGVRRERDAQPVPDERGGRGRIPGRGRRVDIASHPGRQLRESS